MTTEDTQDLATAERRYGAQVAYTYEIKRCLCHGQRPSSMQTTHPNAQRPPLDMSGQDDSHRIWVAFLLYNNDEYEPERSLRDYAILPMNWLTVTLTGRQETHCQMVFWDEVNKRYRTFSVDPKRRVHVYDKKGFAARGWRFFEVMVTEHQELVIHNFLVAQLGLPMNLAGQLSILTWPMSGNGKSWFCSELIAAALAQGGVVDFDNWFDRQGYRYRRPCQVPPHILFDYLAERTVSHRIRLLESNPVTVNLIDQAAKLLGPIPIPASGALPASIIQHVMAASDLASHTNLTSQLADLPDEVDQHQILLASMTIRRK